MISLRSKFKTWKQEFVSDRFGFVLKCLAILFAFANMITLPAFTFRSGFSNISIILSALFVVFAALYIFFRGHFRLCWLIVPYIVFVIYCVLSYLFTRYSFSSLRTICLVYGLMFFVFEFSVNIKKPKLMMEFFLWSTVVLAALIFIDNYQDILSLKTGRIGEKYGNLNQIGWIFSVSFFFCLYRVFFMRERRVISFMIAIVDLIFAGFTGSKGALLLIVTSALVLLFFFFKGKKKLYFLVACVIFICGIALILQIPSFDELRTRIYRMIISLLSGGTNGDISTNQRFAMFEEGFFLFAKSPIFGNGLASFSVISNQTVYSHANLSEMLCNFGVIGLSIWASPFFYNSFLERRNKKLPICLMYSIAIILPSMFFTILYSAKFFAVTAAIIFSFGVDEESDSSVVKLQLWRKPSIDVFLSPNSVFKKVDKEKNVSERAVGADND